MTVYSVRSNLASITATINLWSLRTFGIPGIQYVDNRYIAQSQRPSRLRFAAQASRRGTTSVRPASGERTCCDLPFQRCREPALQGPHPELAEDDLSAEIYQLPWPRGDVVHFDITVHAWSHSHIGMSPMRRHEATELRKPIRLRSMLIRRFPHTVPPCDVVVPSDSSARGVRAHGSAHQGHHHQRAARNRENRGQSQSVTLSPTTKRRV